MGAFSLIAQAEEYAEKTISDEVGTSILTKALQDIARDGFIAGFKAALGSE